MKHLKGIITILCFIVICSCDKELFEDFFVKNNHTSSIAVSFETMNGDSNILTIQPNAEVLVYQNRGFGHSVYEFELERLFISFEVIASDTVISKINCLRNENWEYIELSDTQAEFRLLVDSTHF